MDVIEVYKTLINRLKTLVDDPHPGLSTWTEFLGRNIVELHKLWVEQHDAKHKYIAAVVTETGKDTFPLALCTSFGVADELKATLNKHAARGFGTLVKVVPIEEVPPEQRGGA